MDTFALVVTILVALFFTYTNGFHDSANAIATSVSTRALTPRAALAMAAVMNLAGAFLGSGVAKTVSEGLIETPEGSKGMGILFAALIGAITWNLVTWYFGLPSSSSHALFGGMVGAALAGGTDVIWHGVVDKIIVPMFVSPVVGLVGGYLVMTAIMWIFRKANPHKAKRGFRIAQTVSAAGMALGHGLQDAQKTMGVVVMALVISGHSTYKDPIPVWVKIVCALMLSLGTYAGGGGSCGRWGGRSLSWIRRRGSLERPRGRRSCSPPRISSRRRFPRRMSSPRRSWVWGRRSG